MSHEVQASSSTVTPELIYLAAHANVLPMLAAILHVMNLNVNTDADQVNEQSCNSGLLSSRLGISSWNF